MCVRVVQLPASSRGASDRRAGSSPSYETLEREFHPRKKLEEATACTSSILSSTNSFCHVVFRT